MVTIIVRHFLRPLATILKSGKKRPLSEDLEELVYQWIVSKRLQKQRVTRKRIQQKAVELYNSTIKGELEF